MNSFFNFFRFGRQPKNFCLLLSSVYMYVTFLLFVSSPLCLTKISYFSYLDFGWVFQKLYAMQVFLFYISSRLFFILLILIFLFRFSSRFFEKFMLSFKFCFVSIIIILTFFFIYQISASLW